MKKYKHLFFDLDHTLWDFEQNSRQALTSIYYEFDLRQWQIQSPDHFIDTYHPINYQMWADYREGKIDAPTVKRKRFQDTLKQFGLISESVITDVENYYMQHLPNGGTLMPNVVQMLQKFHQHFDLHIVTNGFRAITDVKLRKSKIQHFFQLILSAEEVGVLKPNAKVFHTAIHKTGATVENSLFIGDNLIADIQGAKSVGMDQVFYNPEKKFHNETPTYEITDMKELVDLVMS